MIQPFAICRLVQKDNYTFSIIWNDGREQYFRLSDVQKTCPCANCRDEQTGKVRIDPKWDRDDVRAVTIKSVGRYALQIQFTSGCSMGIYSFDLLRNMGGE